MTNEKTEYSKMHGFRLFGIDFFFGYFNIKKAAGDSEMYGENTVNTILSRGDSDVPKCGLDVLDSGPAERMIQDLEDIGIPVKYQETIAISLTCEKGWKK